MTTDFTTGIALAFLLFWAVGGWTKVDCTLDVQQACAAVQENWKETSRLEKELP